MAKIATTVSQNYAQIEIENEKYTVNWMIMIKKCKPLWTVQVHRCSKEMHIHNYLLASTAYFSTTFFKTNTLCMTV